MHTTPLFFPFTHIPAQVAGVLNNLFTKTMVWQPIFRELPKITAEKEAKGRLEVIRTDEGDAQAMERILSAYREWALIHEKTGLEHFRTKKAYLPFFEDDSVHSIRDQIKKGPAAGSCPDFDPLLQARLFLQLAQEYDIHFWEMRDDLSGFRNMEQNLFSDLKGEAPEEIDKTEAPPDPGSHMTSARMSAWAALYAHSPRESDLMMTLGRSMKDLICDAFPEAVMMTIWDKIPLTGDDLPDPGVSEALSAFFDHPDQVSEPPLFPETGGEKASVEFYRIPDMTPSEFFRRWSPDESDFKPLISGKEMVIGIIEIK